MSSWIKEENCADPRLSGICLRRSSTMTLELTIRMDSSNRVIKQWKRSCGRVDWCRSTGEVLALAFWHFLQIKNSALPRWDATISAHQKLHGRKEWYRVASNCWLLSMGQDACMAESSKTHPRHQEGNLPWFQNQHTQDCGVVQSTH